ncbi:MAG: hypothetical protein EB012_12260, partial [Gammaproteobacteria bacterium]|nr:hypothetical protein [Gammaproteobacteria bacterium]
AHKWHVSSLHRVVGGAHRLFIEHFQRIARGHFTIRRLERKYSPDSIQMAYEALKAPSRERPFLSGPRP